jgi:hypothetical protein
MAEVELNSMQEVKIQIKEHFEQGVQFKDAGK